MKAVRFCLTKPVGYVIIIWVLYKGGGGSILSLFKGVRAMTILEVLTLLNVVIGIIGLVINNKKK